jgi:hypothetical protein
MSFWEVSSSNRDLHRMGPMDGVVVDNSAALPVVLVDRSWL